MVARLDITQNSHDVVVPSPLCLLQVLMRCLCLYDDLQKMKMEFDSRQLVASSPQAGSHQNGGGRQDTSLSLATPLGTKGKPKS